MLNFKVWAIPLMILIGSVSYAQIPQNPLGLHPSRIKWKQINTDKVQIVFPIGNENQGLRVADVSHYLWDLENMRVGGKRKKISIFLYPLNTRPNGQVTPGPFRSEFFITPPQFNCTTDWLDNLAIHEYQHVKQFTNADRGITKLAHRIFGSWAWGGFAATALPRWFWEGDAVLAETALSASGRGRMPAFLMEYRTLLQNGIQYGYEKAGAGSYKDFIPDWYNLGYHMTAQAKADFGLDIWDKVIPEAATYKGIFYPFSRSLKKHTGMNTKALYEKTMSTIQEELKKQEPRLGLRSALKSLNPPKKTFTNYTNGQFIKGGKVIAIKSGFQNIPTIVLLDEEWNESKVVTPGVRHDHPFGTLSTQKAKLVWAELNQDLRWRSTNYSDIYIYNLGTNKKTKITHQGRYYSPNLSHSGKSIVAVHIDPSVTVNLEILSPEDPKQNHSIKNQEGWMYSYPVWGKDDQSIVVVGQKNEKHAILSIDRTTGQYDVVFGPSNHIMSHPVVKGDTILFSSGINGIQNIFAVTPERKFYQITHSNTGAFHPNVSINGQSLIFSEFSPQGYELKMKPFLENWMEIEDYQSEYPFQDLINHQENEGSILPEIVQKEWEIQKYSKATGLILPHSLLPTLEPPLYGGSVLLDNKFSTLSGEVGTYFNENSKDWTYFADFTYGGWWPEITLGYRHWNRNNDIYQFKIFNDTTLHTNFYREHWSENRLSVGLSLPLRFNTGSFFHRLTAGIRLNHLMIDIEGNQLNADNNRDTLIGTESAINSFKQVDGVELRNSNFNTLDYSITYQSFMRAALQHVDPRWGIALNARLQNNLDKTMGGDLLTTTALVYLPGLMSNHSLKMGIRYRKSELLDPYSFPDAFFYPKGYDSFVNDQVTYMSIDYKLPIAYPDWAIGSLAFIQRVKLNLFYNHARSILKFPFDTTEYARSLGLEWTFDIRVLRLLDMDLGFRYSYLLDGKLSPNGKSHQFDFLVVGISG